MTDNAAPTGAQQEAVRCNPVEVDAPGVGKMLWCERHGYYFGIGQECPAAPSATPAGLPAEAATVDDDYRWKQIQSLAWKVGKKPIDELSEVEAALCGAFWRAKAASSTIERQAADIARLRRLLEEVESLDDADETYWWDETRGILLARIRAELDATKREGG